MPIKALSALGVAGGLTIWIVRVLPHVSTLAMGERAAGSLFLLFAVVMAWWLVRGRAARSRLVWEAAFIASLWIGAWFAVRTLIPFSWSWIPAAALLAFPFFWPRPWSQALFFVIGAAGAGALLGIQLPFLASVLFLVGFNLCVMVVTPAREHLQTFLADLVRRQVVVGAFSLLTSEVVLPLLLVARASLSGAWIGGALVGGLLMGASYGLSRPRPAVTPWAAIGTLAVAGILQVVGWMV